MLSVLILLSVGFVAGCLLKDKVAPIWNKIQFWK